MPNFEEAYNITMGNEGFYSNDHVDPGGETFKGIARNYNPNWSGWVIIDRYKKNINFPNILRNDKDLDKSVKAFYKVNYWDVNLLDKCNSQQIANEMFDTGVNMGVGRAARFLQQALNVLNKNGAEWPDLGVDGKIGDGTIKALDSCLKYKGSDFLYKVLNILQGNFYIENMTKNPTQEKYAYGWLSRVNFLKN